MRSIALVGGGVAYFDAADAALVSGYLWRLDHGYAVAGVYRGVHARRPVENVYMHRLISGAVRGQFVDHRDRNRLNNTRGNLRLCDRRQNAANSAKRAGCSSAFKGVSWSRERKLWEARIQASGRGRTIGFFASEVEAARAYDAAALVEFGEFARLNLPEEQAASGTTEVPA